MSCPRLPWELAGGCHLHLGPRTPKSLPLDGRPLPIHTRAEAAGPCMPPVTLHCSAGAGGGAERRLRGDKLTSRLKKKKKRKNDDSSKGPQLPGRKTLPVSDGDVDGNAGRGHKTTFLQETERKHAKRFILQVSFKCPIVEFFFKGQCLNLRSARPSRRKGPRPPPLHPAPSVTCLASVLPPGLCTGPAPPGVADATFPYQLWLRDTGSHGPHRMGHPPSHSPLGHPHCLR